jgi:drug/metabolite transporter (DMT)-like permease
MDFSLTLLVLLSAVMHATWNAMVKVEQDRLIAFALIHGTGVVLGAVLVALAPPLRPEAWWYLGPSVVLQAAYIGLLMLAYQTGDLSQVYPIARGSAPLGVTLLATLGGAPVPPLQIAGVAAVSGGILSLAWRSALHSGLTAGPDAAPHAGAKGVSLVAPNGARTWLPIAYALALGLTIAAYTVLDSHGVRAGGSPLAYGGWIFILYGLPWMAAALLRARWRRGLGMRGGLRLGRPEPRHWVLALGAGSLCFASYLIVVRALQSAAAAPVSALRETSVIFAALIGMVLLKEPLGVRRVIAALVVAAGIVMIRLA